MDKGIEIFDLESVYDEQISPLMKQIIDICKEHNLPMIASFAFENCEERGPGCCTTHLSFKERPIKEFAEAMSIIKGKTLLSAITIMSGVNANE